MKSSACLINRFEDVSEKYFIDNYLDIASQRDSGR